MNKKNISIISASPNTRKFAREVGADLRFIKGSQREGRINEDDIKSFVKKSLSENKIATNENLKQEYNHSEFGEIEIKDIPRIKKIAGPHLQKSWNEIPHVTQHDEADFLNVSISVISASSCWVK